jgi:hypothetical protein
MRRKLLLPLALAAAAAVLPVALPASAASTPTPPAPTGARDITKIATAERDAHKGLLQPRATNGTNGFLADTYPVGLTGLSAVDTARGVAARWPNPASSVRNLPILIWYPAASGRVGGGDTIWAPPRGGHFPLVVFAPGYDSNPQTYQVFLHAIAAQGYIVASPVFPIEASIAGAAPAGRSNAEILNQMYDMSAVITQMVKDANTRGNFLNTAMNPSQVGVIGHSDGAMTVAGMTMSTSYSDPRIKVADVMSGAGPYGLTWNRRRVVPTMVEQATGDPYNAPSNSQWLFNNTTGPRGYLTVNGPYHIWPLIGNDVTSDAVRRAVIAHLDGVLKNGGFSALFRMIAAGNTPGATSLRLAS